MGICNLGATRNSFDTNESPISPDYRYPQPVDPKSLQAPIQVPIPTCKFALYPGTAWLSQKSDFFANRREYTFSGSVETTGIHLLICMVVKFWLTDRRPSISKIRQGCLTAGNLNVSLPRRTLIKSQQNSMWSV